MKKLLLITLSLFSVISLSAQIFPQELFTAYNLKTEKENLFKKYKVNELHSTYTRKGKLKNGSEILMRYDENGNNIYESRPHKGEEFYTGYAHNKMTSRVKLKKGDTVYVYLYSYDEKGNWIKTLYYKKSMHHLKATTLREYNQQGKVTKQEELNEKNQSTYRMEYEYWENGSRKTSRTYKKGKLQRTYTYECDMKGEIEKTKVNYCSKKSVNNDGSFVEIFESKKGNKVERTVYTYNADSCLITCERFNPKGNLVWKSAYTYLPNKEKASSINYNKKGKAKYKYLYSYNDLGLLVQTEFYYNNQTEAKSITRNEYKFKSN